MSGPADPPAEAIEAVKNALIAEGCAPDNSIHGWRCKYPDRYGPCDCVEETAKVALAAALPPIRAHIANQILALNSNVRDSTGALDAAYHRGFSAGRYGAARVAAGVGEGEQLPAAARGGDQHD